MLGRRVSLRPRQASTRYRLGLQPMIYKVEISTCRSCTKTIRRGWMQLARGGSSFACNHWSSRLPFPTASPQNATSRENCPKFIVRQGACFEPKAVGGGAIEARNDACTVFRYTATPGVNETGKLTGSGRDKIRQSLPAATGLGNLLLNFPKFLPVTTPLSATWKSRCHRDPRGRGTASESVIMPAV
jgi:hypothetical protein